MFLNWNVTNVFLQLNKGYNLQDRKKIIKTKYILTTKYYQHIYNC